MIREWAGRDLGSPGSHVAYLSTFKRAVSNIHRRVAFHVGVRDRLDNPGFIYSMRCIKWWGQHISLPVCQRSGSVNSDPLPAVPHPRNHISTSLKSSGISRRSSSARFIKYFTLIQLRKHLKGKGSRNAMTNIAGLRYMKTTILSAGRWAFRYTLSAHICVLGVVPCGPRYISGICDEVMLPDILNEAI